MNFIIICKISRPQLNKVGGRGGAESFLAGEI